MRLQEKRFFSPCPSHRKQIPFKLGSIKMSTKDGPFLTDAQQLDAKLQERRKTLPEEDKGLAYWELWCDREGVDKVPTWSSLACYITDFVAPMEEAVTIQAQQDPTKALLQGVKVFVEPVLRFRDKALGALATTEPAQISSSIPAKKSHMSTQTPKASGVNRSVQVAPARQHFSTQTPISRKGVDVGLQAMSARKQKSTQTPISAFVALSALSTCDGRSPQTTAVTVSMETDPLLSLHHQEVSLQEGQGRPGSPPVVGLEQGLHRKRLFGMQDSFIAKGELEVQATTPISVNQGVDPAVTSITPMRTSTSSSAGTYRTSCASNESSTSNIVTTSVTTSIRGSIWAYGSSSSSSSSSPPAPALSRRVGLPGDPNRPLSTPSDGPIKVASNVTLYSTLVSPPHPGLSTDTSFEVEQTPYDGGDHPETIDEELYPMFKAEEFQLMAPGYISSPQAMLGAFKYNWSNDVKTVPQVLQEWRFGLKDEPAIQDLNIIFAGRWWNIADMGTSKVRSCIVEEYVRLVLHDGHTNTEAIQALERLQGVTGINTLADALRVQRELAAETELQGKGKVEERDSGGPSQKRVRLDPSLTNGTETKAVAPSFPIRTFNSADNIWIEWTEGWQGEPSMESWIREHGKPWKDEAKNRDDKIDALFQIKQRLVNIIKKAVSTGAVPSAKEAIQAMEEARGEKTAKQFAVSPALQRLKAIWKVEEKRRPREGHSAGTSKQK